MYHGLSPRCNYIAAIEGRGPGYYWGVFGVWGKGVGEAYVNSQSIWQLKRPLVGIQVFFPLFSPSFSVPILFFFLLCVSLFPFFWYFYKVHFKCISIVIGKKSFLRLFTETHILCRIHVTYIYIHILYKLGHIRTPDMFCLFLFKVDFFSSF